MANTFYCFGTARASEPAAAGGLFVACALTPDVRLPQTPPSVASSPGRRARRNASPRESMPSVRIADRLPADREGERAALAAGLLAVPATIPPKYFYDPMGCALYAAICELPEYYLPRTEQAIFEAQRDAIVAAAGQGCQLVDLGAGDGRKAAAWFAHLRPVRYVAVDIAGDALVATLERMASEHPALPLSGVVTDFTGGLDLAADLDPGPATFFYPGSSIGNFDPDAARAFLATLQRHGRSRPGSSLLIGVDTIKDPQRLDAAYDDAIGVTAAFNRNVLRHVNRVLRADFRPEAFRHRGFFNASARRVEMHLEATSAQTVTFDGGERRFAAGERIVTEYSYKYSPEAFAQMLAGAGYAAVRCWQDAAGDFAVFCAA
jgi:dimethylhistidine N-methyltransferase